MGRLTAADFATILSRHPDYRPQIYIETGTRYGVQMQIAVQVFSYCVGIELDAYCYQRSRTALEDFPHASMRHGDSRDLLPRLLREYALDCFIVLDAHYNKQKPPLPKTPFPLWNELEAIRTRRDTQDIVVVDDSHTFGRARPELRYTPDAVEWEGVTRETLRGFFGNERIADTADVGGGYVLWLRANDA